jgi:hypothetical protein
MPTRTIQECGQCREEMRGRPATLEVRMVVVRYVGGEYAGEVGGSTELCSPAHAQAFAARLIDRAWRGKGCDSA